MRSPSIQVIDPEEGVLGEVPLAPYGLTGVSEAQLARTVVRRPAAPKKADTLSLLRDLIPDSPLGSRLFGLAALLRR